MLGTSFASSLRRSLINGANNSRSFRLKLTCFKLLNLKIFVLHIDSVATIVHVCGPVFDVSCLFYVL